MNDIFIERLKQAMERTGINQNQLGMLSGVTPSKVNKYLKGAYKPKQDALIAMAKVLRVSPQWLGGYDEVKPNDLVAKLNLLNQAGKDKVEAYIEDLLDNPKYCVSEIKVNIA